MYHVCHVEQYSKIPWKHALPAQPRPVHSLRLLVNKPVHLFVSISYKAVTVRDHTPSWNLPNSSGFSVSNAGAFLSPGFGILCFCPPVLLKLVCWTAKLLLNPVEVAGIFLLDLILSTGKLLDRKPVMDSSVTWPALIEFNVDLPLLVWLALVLWSEGFDKSISESIV